MQLSPDPMCHQEGLSPLSCNYKTTSVFLSAQITSEGMESLSDGLASAARAVARIKATACWQKRVEKPLGSRRARGLTGNNGAVRWNTDCQRIQGTLSSSLLKTEPAHERHPDCPGKLLQRRAAPPTLPSCSGHTRSLTSSKPTADFPHTQ